MTVDGAATLILDAGSFADLMEALDERDARRAYKKLAKLIHPDAVTGPPDPRVFLRLKALFDARDRIAGDIADLEVIDDGRALRKVPRQPRDNDLMEAEAEALRTLRRDGDPRFRPYAPRLLESFTHSDPQRRLRRVNVIERLDGFVPLSRVGRELDPRDAAWMWRRLLTGLGWAHRAGVVHGAILEEHVLIHPAEHGLALVDWCYSGGSASAIVKRHRDHYPPEVLTDRVVTPATDIFMATGLIRRLVGARMPAALRRFCDGCVYDAPRMRPQDAWALLGELDELLHSLYGPRTFRPFTL